MSNLKEKQFYDIIENAFLKSHHGSSTDDTIIDDRLNADFIKICKSILPSVNEFDLNWALMNMRKQGKLGSVTTKRKRCDHTDYIHASEIAARLMYDRHNLSIDRVLCHSVHRKEFDSIANSIAP